MRTWEYKKEELLPDFAENGKEGSSHHGWFEISEEKERLLLEMADDDGWELISVQHDEEMRVIFYFRRKLSSERLAVLSMNKHHSKDRKGIKS